MAYCLHTMPTYLTRQTTNDNFQKLQYLPTLEDLLTSVKGSNSHFHIQQTPFSAIISVKTSLIKDKIGKYPAPITQNPRISSDLEAENHALQAKILEKNVDSLQREKEQLMMVKIHTKQIALKWIEVK